MQEQLEQLAERPEHGYRVAIDTGGTFTDVTVARPDGTIFVAKVSSTPEAPDAAVIEGLRQALGDLEVGPGEVTRFVHGTTVATNALITRGGARVGLVTTAGFADVLQIGYQTRPQLYARDSRRPEPLVAREHTWEVEERVAHDGTVLTPLDEEKLKSLAEEIARSDLDVVVISLLNAYVNPRHEQRIAEFLRATPSAPAVVVATDISGELREFERTSTAVLNGYVQPKVDSYLERLEGSLKDLGVKPKLWVMQSNGGLISGSSAREQSVRTLLSGLAGGVIGAARWAKQLGLPRVISFDIGGTSTDIALIRDGVPDDMTSGEIEGFPIRLPAVDIHTIGAGGGSIAWTDSAGALRVGPHSAGATPGPVCYGRGGTEITVTDAHLALGRLGTRLLDGRLELDKESVEATLNQLATKLGMTDDETAAGVLRVIGSTMGRGVRKVSIERGIDIRDCTLMAFGGAGPLHAADLLQELHFKSAVIPPHPGVSSALGMLDAAVRSDFVATIPSQSDTPQKVQTLLDELETRAGEFLATENLAGQGALVTRSVDLRYKGQSYELTVPWEESPDAQRAAFDRLHRESYGFADDQAELEAVTARVSVEVPTAETHREASAGGAHCDPIGHRPVYFAGGWMDTPIYRRADLPVGVDVPGPLVAEQLDSTVVVGPNQICRTDEFGFMHIVKGEQR
ncbi:5-oxoprolinase [Arthrobacter crystallopoietes BAB-32]|uniref:5-oxoprolinase n=1 Tax=Arthrobacter crystallopoietes BAB-32 TaxID=1246476 RepID=N1V793_9MICC|nr:hydantoinase/oxoprolinase family protein [Arthrobacter crystallopoietes]EMY35982.1 5-oxoprolinase [Arthrobacter crystallopoietes BAB-32]